LRGADRITLVDINIKRKILFLKEIIEVLYSNDGSYDIPAMDMNIRMTPPNND
jgi:hypothetical protein